MARDGSGTYTRVEGPYVNGNVADANEMNNELDDIADAITDSINNAGTKAFGANQSMGGNRLTDLAAPSSANDAARKAYVDSAITAASQPLDATLTALAALSWSSGNALVQFTAADTVSLTLAPSVTTVTGGAGSATTPTFNFSGDTNTGMYQFGADDIGIATGGALRFRIANSFTYLASGVFYVNDGAASTPTYSFVNDTDCGLYRIGANNLGLSLNSSKAIDFSTALIDFSVPARSRIPLSSETSGTLTAASANKKVKMSGDITINDGVFTADDFILVENNSSSSRNITQDTGMTLRVNGTATTGSRVILPYGVALISFDTNAVAMVCGAIT